MASSSQTGSAGPGPGKEMTSLVVLEASMSVLPSAFGIFGQSLSCLARQLAYFNVLIVAKKDRTVTRFRTAKFFMQLTTIFNRFYFSILLGLDIHRNVFQDALFVPRILQENPRVQRCHTQKAFLQALRRANALGKPPKNRVANGARRALRGVTCAARRA